MKIVERGEIKLVGMSEKIVMPNNTIPQLWEKFSERSGEIKNVIGKAMYGIAENMQETEEGYTFDDVVCLEVSEFSDIPEGMITKTLKPAKYMVFTFKGPLFDEDGTSKIGDYYNYIYGKLIPDSGNQIDESFNFEYYDERFIIGDIASEMDIYIPIK